MLLVETKPEVGQLYAFVYDKQPAQRASVMSPSFGGVKTSTVGNAHNGTKRLVLVQRVDDDGIFGHDFLAGGPRQFKYNKIEKVKNFTNHLAVYSYEGVNEGDVPQPLEFENNGCIVFEDEENELMYVVNYKG